MDGTLKRLAKRVLPDAVVHKVARPYVPPGGDCPLPGGRLTRRPDGGLFHFCLPLEDPTWVSPDDATYLVDDDAVLGFEVDGQHYCVSWDVMAGHHVANLVLDGRPWLLTLCDACSGGGLYDPVIDGVRHRFRVDGVYRGTPYVLDKPGGSLWTMVTMQPVQGVAEATGPLPRFPMVQATWLEWKTLHPETLAVHDPGEPLDGHGGTQRKPSHDNVPRFFIKQGTYDPRLPGGDLVLGVELDGHARAYPLDGLHAAGGIANDELAGTPIVAVALPGSWLCLAFSRQVGDQVLELGWEGGVEHAILEAKAGREPMLVDQVTGSRWDLFGKAVDGPLAGSTLPFAWGGLQKWFNWGNLNPGTEIWTAG
jgi:hypothetical protein